jgi:thiamine-monophosphate kinase
MKIRNWCKPRENFSGRAKGGFRIVVGMGDDASVVRMATPSSLVFTTDTLIEGTHFNLDSMREILGENVVWQSLGRKAMAVNLSDLAAMGGAKPLFALVTLGLGGDISVDTVDNLYKGMGKLIGFYGFFIVGGDIIRSDKSMVSVSLVGDLKSRRPITRSGAKIGDVLMATGPLGLSSAGLEILSGQIKPRNPGLRALLLAHIEPEPRIKEGGILSGEDIMATSLIDASDDLLTSLEILSDESGVGFEINMESAPVHPALLEFSRAMKTSPYKFILYGGEDYELLFTVRPSKVGGVMSKIPSAYALGDVKPKSFGIRFKMNGKPFRLRDSRFRHF